MRRGFTLIELLIVVAIIGILAAIAVPSFLNARARAKIARSYSDIRSLGTAIETMRVDRNVLLVDYWDNDTDVGQKRIKETFRYFLSVGQLVTASGSWVYRSEATAVSKGRPLRT